MTSIVAGCGSTAEAPSPPLSFGAPVAYENPGNAGAGQLRVVDFNGDGHLDLAVMSDPLSLLKNVGSGTFQETKASSLDGKLVSSTLATADLNRDGFGDIIVRNHAVAGGSGIWAFYGAADGSLATPVRLSEETHDEEARLFAGDATGDGVPEVIICDLSSIEVMRVDASKMGKRASGAEFTTSSKCDVVDIDGDGHADVIAAGIYASSMIAADLNGDGHADIISAFRGALVIRLANKDGSLDEPRTVTTGFDGGQRSSMAFADFDGDGHLDIVLSASSEKGANVVILRGDSTGNLTQSSVDLGLAADLVGEVAAGDFDGDGLPDIAVAYGARTYVLRNTSH